MGNKGDGPVNFFTFLRDEGVAWRERGRHYRTRLSKQEGQVFYYAVNLLPDDITCCGGV